MEPINACQIHASDAIQLTTQIEPRGVATRPVHLVNLVGSSTGAVARRLILGLCPGFPPSCRFRTGRDPVSSARHIARSVRISRTTRSCILHIKSYGT